MASLPGSPLPQRAEFHPRYLVQFSELLCAVGMPCVVVWRWHHPAGEVALPLLVICAVLSVWCCWREFCDGSLLRLDTGGISSTVFGREQASMAWDEVGLIRVRVLGNPYFRYLWFGIQSRDGLRTIRYRANMGEVDKLIDMLNAKAQKHAISIETERLFQPMSAGHIPNSSVLLSRGAFLRPDD